VVIEGYRREAGRNGPFSAVTFSIDGAARLHAARPVSNHALDTRLFREPALYDVASTSRLSS
jgi:hypothetical protein